MYNLDLFIIRSGKATPANKARLIGSFETDKIKINKISLKTFSPELMTKLSYEPFFAVFFDDEMIDSRLLQALPFYLEALEHGIYDVVKCLKKTGDTIMESPRFFKKGIVLGDNSLLPKNADKLKFVRALDGWIKDNVRDKI